MVVILVVDMRCLDKIIDLREVGVSLFFMVRLRLVLVNWVI